MRATAKVPRKIKSKRRKVGGEEKEHFYPSVRLLFSFFSFQSAFCFPRKFHGIVKWRTNIGPECLFASCETRGTRTEIYGTVCMRFSFPVFSQGGTDRVAVLFYVVGARRADWEPPLRMGWLRRFRSIARETRSRRESVPFGNLLSLEFTYRR